MSDNNKGFYIGNPSSKTDFKAEISRIRDDKGNGTITIVIVAENGSKVARIEGDIHYPLLILRDVDRICKQMDGKAFITDERMRFSLDSWHHYNEGEFKLSDFKSYNDLLDHLWSHYCMNSILEQRSNIVYL